MLHLCLIHDCMMLTYLAESHLACISNHPLSLFEWSEHYQSQMHLVGHLHLVLSWSNSNLMCKNAWRDHVSFVWDISALDFFVCKCNFAVQLFLHIFNYTSDYMLMMFYLILLLNRTLKLMLWSWTCPVLMAWEREVWDWPVDR